ncbi:spore coat protein YlbD [Oceanobacillus sp. SE10311]|uniref:spore coat protein YlbD n=2 Tax=Oceanobacillus TaxID=182709 RepID=UPI00300E3ED1
MMAEESNVELKRFKSFINSHPKLVRKIRKDGKSWQEIYEQWVLLGEDDIHWEQYKEETDEKSKSGEEKKQTFSKLDLKPDFVKQILKYTETVDVNKLQEQVQQLSDTIATVQEIVDIYKKPPAQENRTRQPFDWFRD